MKAHTESQEVEAITGHGDGGAGTVIDVLFPINPTKAERAEARAHRKAKEQATPSGAGVVVVKSSAPQAGRVVGRMAQTSAGGFRRRWESCGGRALSASDMAEAEAIYHAAFAGAAARSGFVPVVPEKRLADGQTVSDALRALIVRKPWGGLAGRSGLRVLALWLRALKTANRLVRSNLWGGGAEAVISQTASLDDLASLKRSLEGGEGRTVGESICAESMATYVRPFSSGARRSLRLRVWWFRQCLVVFWSDKGGQRWQAGLRDDLRRVAHAARVARHGGLSAGIFADSLSDSGAVRDGAAKDSVARLVKRIGAGDALLTSSPALADGFLRIYRRGVAWDTRPASVEVCGVCGSSSCRCNTLTVREGAGWARWMSAPVGIVARDSGAGLVGSWSVRRPSFGGFIVTASGARLGAFSFAGDAAEAEAFKLNSYASGLVMLGARGAASVASARQSCGVRAVASQAAEAARASYVAWWGAALTLADERAEAEAVAEASCRAARARAARRVRALLPTWREVSAKLAEAVAKCKAARAAEAEAQKRRGARAASDRRAKAARVVASIVRRRVRLARMISASCSPALARRLGA